MSPEPQEVPACSGALLFRLIMRRGLGQLSLSLTGWRLFRAQPSDLERPGPILPAFSSGSGGGW